MTGIIDILSWNVGHHADVPIVITAGYTWFAVNVVDAVKQNDLIGMACIIITAIYSVISWGIIAYKYLQFHLVRHQTHLFKERCRAGKGSLRHAFQIAGEYPDSPLSHILREAYIEMEMVNWYEDDKGLSLDGKIDAARASVGKVIDLVTSEQIENLESRIGFLSTTSNVCPLVGLFGTVWGILGAFQVVATQGTVAVGSLAPGVSTALMTTVAGLIAAIPAVIAYNYFLGKVQGMVKEMDTFGMEITNIIQKNIIKRGSR